MCLCVHSCGSALCSSLLWLWPISCVSIVGVWKPESLRETETLAPPPLPSHHQLDMRATRAEGWPGTPLHPALTGDLGFLLGVRGTSMCGCPSLPHPALPCPSAVGPLADDMVRAAEQQKVGTTTTLALKPLPFSCLPDFLQKAVRKPAV